MKLKRFLGLIAASSLGVSSLTPPAPANAQAMAACPDPSTLNGFVADGVTIFDPTFISVTGGSCASTPDEYGVTVYKMGLCINDPTPASGSAADYSSCSLSFEDTSGSAASFAAGGSVALPASLATRPDDGTYSYAMILISTTFNIKATYGPLGDGTTYYSTSTSVGSTGSPDRTGPATVNPVLTNSFNPRVSCDSQDTVSGSSGPMTGTLLNSSEERIPDSTAVTSCAGANYILGVVALTSPVTIDETVTALDATFTVTNNGTTIVSDDPLSPTGIIFDSGPFDVVLSVVR